MKPVLASLLFGAVLILASPQQKDTSPEVLLGTAIHQQEAEGDLEAAIATYKQFLARHANRRPLAAKAQFHLGLCYEKLGNAEARKAYERVVRDYPDQQEIAAQARVRLGALGRPARVTTASGMAVRRLWAGETVHNLNGAVSPDGRYFSYRDMATRQVMIRDLVTGEAHRLTAHVRRNVGFSTFSPDGKQVAYTWSNLEQGLHELRIVRFDARPAGTVKASEPYVLYSRRGEEVRIIRAHQWSPDGKYILATVEQPDSTNQIALVSTADGSARVLKTLDWRSPLKMSFSLDGRYIAYDFPPKEDSPARDIFLLATDGSREIPLVEHPADDRLLGWAPDGERILFSSDRAGTIDAWVVPVVEGKPQGSPARVKRDIGRAVRPMGFGANGSFYYGFSTERFDLYIATLDPETGKVLVPPTRATERVSDTNARPAWSADGQYLAYLSQPRAFPGGFGTLIVIRSLKTGEEREILPKLNAGTNYGLHWSPDGKYFLVGGRDDKNRYGLFQVDSKTGDATPIVYGNPRVFEDVPPACWSRDGKAIFYLRNDLDSNPPVVRIVRRDLETRQEKELYRAVSSGTPRSLLLSPDGHWLTFRFFKPHPGRNVNMIVPAGGGEARELPIPLPQDNEARSLLTRWTPDSRYVLALKFPKGLGGEERELWRIPAEGGEPQKLGLDMRRMYYDHAVHPDGRRIAFSTYWPKAEVWVMENFLPELGASRPDRLEQERKR